MSITQISNKELPPASIFLDSVCPGNDFLDDNVHFPLFTDQIKQSGITELQWPLTGARTNVHARIDSTYLNVARPPFPKQSRRNLESSTYVSLPLHVARTFSRVKNEVNAEKRDGLSVGANVNPLSHDLFKLVEMNPGCMSAMIALRLGNIPSTANLEARSPFNKMTNGINRLLRMGLSDSVDSSQIAFSSIYDGLPENTSGGDGMPAKTKMLSIFAKLLDYDPKTYFTRLRSSSVTKLLVSVNVSVLNVFALDENYAYASTTEVTSKTSIFPLTDLLAETVTGKPIPTTSNTKPYQKVIEKPLLRLHLRKGVFVTRLLTLSDNSTVILGLNTGEVVLINLCTFRYRLFPNLTKSFLANSRVAEGSTFAVTALSTFTHPNYENLVVVGYATGEVTILDPAAPADSLPYVKRVEGKDNYLTFFKLFDLGPFSQKEPVLTGKLSPEYLVGHFKLSHKAVTSIASTLPSEGMTVPNKPMILAISAEDGLVRFIDLVCTHGKNYGDTSKFYNTLIVSDIVSSYFQDGIRSIRFSPDARYFCLGGKGDIIEVFRLTYYNINGLLHKNSNSANPHKTGRSRSGTVNSSGSGNQRTPSMFSLSTFAASVDTSKGEHHDNFPPSIKDIDIVTRLKGHTSTVEIVRFVENEEFYHSETGNSTGTYKLISCGSDGKVLLWDFDSKAFPRTKKSHVSSSRTRTQTHSENAQKPLTPKTVSAPTFAKSHTRGTSWSLSNEDSAGALSTSLGISNILSPSPTPIQQENSEDQRNIAFSLYRSLHDVRLKKHYAKLVIAKDKQKKFLAIIHAIVNDKELPSIQVPLLTIDMSCFVRDGRLQGFDLGPDNFWIFARNGDIFRYTLLD